MIYQFAKGQQQYLGIIFNIIESTKPMPIYEETWQQKDYILQKNMNLRDLPKNHLEKLKTVKFDFVDYKVFDQFACFPYERMMIQCFNNYGIIEATRNAECNEIMTFFKTCVQTNAFFGHLKQTDPEGFQGNQYSRERPAFQELGL